MFIAGWGHMDLKFGNACSGAVFVHSEGKKSSISPNGWSETAGKQLCKDLKCGELRLIKPIQSTAESTWHRNFNCDGVETPQNIWDCENSSQTVTSAEEVFIECQGKIYFCRTTEMIMATLQLCHKYGYYVRIIFIDN